jgi:hypothetical protein
VSNAYAEVLNELSKEDNFDSESINIIRLMGKTGVCVGWLEDDVLKGVLSYAIEVLQKREFIDVLLPWV